MTTHVYPPLPPGRRSNIELFHGHDATGPALSYIYYEMAGQGSGPSCLAKMRHDGSRRKSPSSRSCCEGPEG
jgi:hypothetical protein